ncbi:hypothetical protein AB6O49_02120 [Streptomyces sp. SBR177]
MASLTAVVVAAVALIVVLTQRDGGDKSNQGGGSGGGEVFLQNTSASGPDPFTRSTARADNATVSPPALPSPSGGDANATRSVQGSTPGLYGAPTARRPATSSSRSASSPTSPPRTRPSPRWSACPRTKSRVSCAP